MSVSGRNERAGRNGEAGKNERAERNEGAGKNEKAGSSDFFKKKVFKFLSIEKNLLTCDHNI